MSSPNTGCNIPHDHRDSVLAFVASWNECFHSVSAGRDTETCDSGTGGQSYHTSSFRPQGVAMYSRPARPAEDATSRNLSADEARRTLAALLASPRFAGVKMGAVASPTPQGDKTMSFTVKEILRRRRHRPWGVRRYTGVYQVTSTVSTSRPTRSTTRYRSRFTIPTRPTARRSSRRCRSRRLDDQGVWLATCDWDSDQSQVDRGTTSLGEGGTGMGTGSAGDIRTAQGQGQERTVRTCGRGC